MRRETLKSLQSDQKQPPPPQSSPEPWGGAGWGPFLSTVSHHSSSVGGSAPGFCLSTQRSVQGRGRGSQVTSVLSTSKCLGALSLCHLLCRPQGHVCLCRGSLPVCSHLLFLCTLKMLCSQWRTLGCGCPGPRLPTSLWPCPSPQTLSQAGPSGSLTSPNKLLRGLSAPIWAPVGTRLTPRPSLPA